MRAATET